MYARLKFVGAALFAGLASCYSPPTDIPAERLEDPGVLFETVFYSGSNPAFTALQPVQGGIDNPVLPGFYPDPSIVKTNDGYFMVHSTFSFFPGIPVFQSDDLINWTQISNVIDRPGMLDFSGLGMSRGVFAPTIEYHEGQYIVLNTCVDCGGNFLVTATDPSGPWSDPIWLPEIGGIDPSILFHDGRTYIMNNDAPVGEPLYDGHRAIWIREVDGETYQSISAPVVIINGGINLAEQPVWIEGPHIYERDGWFYLSAAEGGTSVNHSQVILRSRSIEGPYTPGPNNPVLTQRDLPETRPHPITSAGHADYVQDDQGNWWAVFLAVQPYEGNHYNTGRETFILPVDWSGEWPVILEAGKTIPHRLDTAHAETESDGHDADEFIWTEDFEDGIGLDWLSLRGTVDDRIILDPDGLRLLASAETISDLATPSFVATRQRHRDATMDVSLDPSTIADEEAAGLALFQNSRHWFTLMADHDADGQLHLSLTQSGEAGDTVIARQAIASDESIESLTLRATADGASYQFAYVVDDGAAQPMGPTLDGRHLSTQTAGGFTGAVFGPYAVRK